MKKQTGNDQSAKKESSETAKTSQSSSQLPSGATIKNSSASEKIKAFNVGNSPNVAHVSDTQAKNINVVSATFNQGNLPSNTSVPLNSSTPSPIASVSNTVVKGDLYMKSTVKTVYQMGPNWPLAEKKFDKDIRVELKALYQAYQTRCQNSELSQALSYYISSEATSLLGSEKRFDLEKEAKQFLTAENALPLLLIQGDSGSGKSLYANLLEQQLWQAHDPKQMESPVPIFIELKSIETSVPKDFIQHVLEHRYGYTVQQIQQLRDVSRFIFILDGYDEMRIATDRGLRTIYLDNELSKWNAKVIVTCRTQYLSSLSSYQHLFATTQNATTASSSFKEIFVASFNTNQIEAYLKIYTEKQKMEWDAKKYLEKLDSLSSVREFIQSPLLLKIVIEILPELEKLQAKQNNQRITRADIYELFTRKWFKREDLRAASKSPDPDGLFGEFSERLAFKMFEEGVTEVGYTPTERNQSSSNEWEQFFSSKDDKIISKRAGCPLRRIGEGLYSFYHKSFMEYFCAMHLYEESGLGEKDDKKFEITLNALTTKPAENKPDLNKKLLTQEPAIIEFLADKIKYNEKAIERLLSIVTASKKNLSISIAAANAITIAKVACLPRSPFSGKDFSYVHINGANLDGAILDHTDLSHADLTGVSLRNAFLGNTDLRHSKMEKVEFGQLAIFGKDRNSIESIAFSPDDHLMAAGQGRKITIWSWRNKEILHTFKGHSKDILLIQFSHDGRFLISCSEIEICLWDVSAKKLIRKLSGYDSYTIEKRTTTFDFSHDEKMFAITGLRGNGFDDVLLQEATTGKILHKFDVEGLGLTVNFCNNDSILVAVTKELFSDSFRHIYLWDAHSGSLINTYQNVTSHSIDKDRRMLAFANKDSTLCVIEISSRNLLYSFEAPKDTNINAICFSPNSKFIAFDKNTFVELLDLKSNKPIPKILKGSSDLITSLCFSGDGRTLMGRDSGNMAYLWDTESGDLVTSLSVKGEAFISYDGKFIHSYDGQKVGVMDANALKMEKLNSFGKTAASIRKVQFSHDGKLFAAGSTNGIIFLWNSQSCELIYTFRDPERGAVYDICFSHNDKMLISSYHEGRTINIWNLITGELLFAYEAKGLSKVSFSYDDTAFITINMIPKCSSGIMKILDITSGKEIHSIEIPSSFSCDFTQDGKMFIAKNQLWNMQLMNPIHKLDGEINEPNIRFSHDANTIAIAEGNSTFSLWDADSGKLRKLIKEYFEFSLLKSKIAFNCDDTILAASVNNQVKLIDIASGKLIASIEGDEGHISEIHYFCFNPRSSQLLICYSRQSIKLWEYLEGFKGQQWLLTWSSYPQLYCRNCRIDGVENLSDTNRALLEQNGAIISTKQKAQDFFTSDIPSFFKSSEKKIKEIPEKLKAAELSPRTPIKSLGEKTKSRISAVFSPLKDKAEELPKKLEKKTGFSIFKPSKDEVKSMKYLEKNEAVDLPKDEEEKIKENSDFKSK